MSACRCADQVNHGVSYDKNYRAGGRKAAGHDCGKPCTLNWSFLCFLLPSVQLNKDLDNVYIESVSFSLSPTTAVL